MPQTHVMTELVCENRDGSNARVVIDAKRPRRKRSRNALHLISQPAEIGAVHNQVDYVGAIGVSQCMRDVEIPIRRCLKARDVHDHLTRFRVAHLLLSHQTDPLTYTAVLIGLIRLADAQVDE